MLDLLLTILNQNGGRLPKRACGTESKDLGEEDVEAIELLRALC